LFLKKNLESLEAGLVFGTILPVIEVGLVGIHLCPENARRLGIHFFAWVVFSRYTGIDG
jgi:hypothetical protein